MTQPAKVQEPSMEEILASIRRIIADDDSAKMATEAPKPSVAPAPPAPAPVAAAPRPAPEPAPAVMPQPQQEIDAVLAEFEPAQTEAEVLDLTEAMTAPPPPNAANFRTIDGESDVVFSDRPYSAVEPAAPRAPEEPRRPTMPSAMPSTPSTAMPAIDHALMSATTTAAVDSAFNSLAHTILGQNARTLEDLVKEMLRPMLKSWLDDNLPSLVERIVRAEIERVSRGRV
jgi:cell pole-organizing protein PopZ